MTSRGRPAGDERADAVTTLTTVFGTPPVEEPYPGGNHHPPGIIHHWDMFCTCTGTSIEAAEVPVASEGREHERVNVIVMPTDDGSRVKWIGAPEMEATGCA